MKKKILICSIASLALMGLASCDDNKEEAIIPGTISNLRYEPREGAVMLRWDVPADSSYFYLKVTYNDPWKQKDRIKQVSIYADSLLVDGLLNRFGNYTFTVQPYSRTHTPGDPLTIPASCNPLPPTYTVFSERELKLTADNLETNAQEPSEGPIANLLDGDGTTFFHTRWSGTVPPAPHYLQLNFSAPLAEQGFKFKFRNRANTNGKPQTIEILISEDGETFVPLTTLDEGMPIASASEYTSPTIMFVDHFQPKHIRFNVTKTNSDGAFFNMADFWFYECVIGTYDPETEDL
jgi:hypothetical protein